MPTLTCKPGDFVKINENMIVTILEVNGDQVRFGLDVKSEAVPIQAPISRAEVYARVYEQDYKHVGHEC